LSKSFMFNALEENDMNIVIGAMKEIVVGPMERVIKQGEDGDCLMLIESGTFHCMVAPPDGEESCTRVCGENDIFGELSVLYGELREASFEAQTKAICWRLDRDTFNAIVKQASMKKRQRYEAFLSKVPLLADMSDHERSQIADAIVSETFEVGEVIIRQGDVGNKFYIIEEGEAEVLLNDTKIEIMSGKWGYSAGEYFGELALIRDQPRKVTVKTTTAVKALSVDGNSFKRLLNVEELVNRSKDYA